MAKQRKERSIKNPDVDTEGIFDSPGIEYRNWIIITKKKLIVKSYLIILYYITYLNYK